MKKSLIVAAFAAAFCLSDAKAADSSWAWSPIGIGIATPAQLPFVQSDVYGIRFGGLFGHNADVYGVDAGVLSFQENLIGLQAAGFSWSQGATIGLQAAIVSVSTTFTGLQIGGLNWNNAEGAGVQFAVANANQADFVGGAAAALNMAPKFNGFQIGAINLVDDMTGFQIGVINATQRLNGGQLGVINLVCESKLPVMVVANAWF